MSLSDLDVKRLPIKDKRYKLSVGNGLSIVIEPIKGKNFSGGKSFAGFMRFPFGRKGKQIDVRIGVYGKGMGKVSLRQAKDEWERLRSWSKKIIEILENYKKRKEKI